MHKKLTESLQRKLVAFGHRRLKRGEIFLLAKAISDKLPIGQALPENIRVYTLNHRNFIDSVVFGLTDYIHLPQEDVNKIYTLIDNLLLWRMTVAFEPALPIFSGDPNNVVDEVTGILRYVDVGDACSVADIAQSASTIAMMFRDFIVECQ